MTATAAPARLDIWLSTERGITRPAAHALIDAGLVTVNGRPGRAGQRIGERDLVEVGDIPAAPAVDIAGPRVDLNILHEDDLLAVIDKPAGMVVHPAAGHASGTLADGLRQRGATWSLLGGSERPGIVHRLDRDTSGLLVVAKSEAAHRALSRQLADRSLGRRYWALVTGVIAEDTAEIDAPIGRDPRDRKRMAVIDAGRDAITDFAVVERCRQNTLLDVSLRSGRTHQIRVHLAYIHHPIVGDPVYGRRHERGAENRTHRLALHARELHFVHPGSGESVTYRSEIPTELTQLLELARVEQL